MQMYRAVTITKTRNMTLYSISLSTLIHICCLNYTTHQIHHSRMVVLLSSGMNKSFTLPRATPCKWRINFFIFSKSNLTV